MYRLPGTALNTALRKITLSIGDFSQQARNRATLTLGVSANEALSAMLRVNTNLVLKLPRVPLFNINARDERLLERRDQLRMEQRLNNVGSGRLLSTNQTTKEEWINALHELSSNEVDESDAILVSCLYSLLRLKPEVVSMS